MTAAFLAMLFGLIILIWSANYLIDGCVYIAHHLKIPTLLIGFVIIGLGTSMPELVVSSSAALQKSSGIALGNAYGSNIANIGLILGLVAFIKPITIHSRILRQELPILIAVTGLAVWQLLDGEISRFNAFLLFMMFVLTISWVIFNNIRNKKNDLFVEEEKEIKNKLANQSMRFPQALFALVVGLLFLLFASNLLVWGGVEIARYLGIDDLIIGLTVVAIGTALPELVSSFAAIRKNEHDLVLGNLLGSNLFNTLAVVGVSGLLHPIAVTTEVLYRDVPVMLALTGLLFISGYVFGRINRILGATFLVCFLGYTSYLIFVVFSRNAVVG